MTRNQNGLNHIVSTIWHYGSSNMASPVQENSIAGTQFKTNIPWRQSGLTNIPLFLIHDFQVLSIFTTCTGYFCLNHYVTENWCHVVQYSSEWVCGNYIYIFVYLNIFNIDYLKNNVLLVRPLYFLSALQIIHTLKCEADKLVNLSTCQTAESAYLRARG